MMKLKHHINKKSSLKKFIEIVFIFLLLGQTSLAKSSSYDEPLNWTIPPNHTTCPNMSSYLWVTHSEGKDCVRYFSGGLLLNAKIVVILLSGDRDKLRTLPIESIPHNTRKQREKVAANYAKKIKTPVIIISRPGTYGSSGDHRLRRQLREFITLDAGLTAIKQRYGINQFILQGHSGGATAAAALMTLGRTDIRCAILTSGAFDLMERDRRRATSQSEAPFASKNIKRRSYYDPLYEIDGIVHDENRHIYILGNPLDKITPFDLQAKFSNALLRADHNSKLTKIPTKPPNYHDPIKNPETKIIKSCTDTKHIEQSTNGFTNGTQHQNHQKPH